MFIDDFLLKTKLISPETHRYIGAPESVKQEIDLALEKRDDLTLYSDIKNSTQLLNLMEQRFDQMMSKNQPLASTSAYTPSGSTLRKLFPGPFEPHAYVSENYWAAQQARREVIVEIIRDGYVLVAPDNYPKKKIKLINQIFEDLKIKYFRAIIADQLNVFGNAFIDPEYTSLKGLTNLNWLLTKNVWPTVNPTTKRVNGWDYWEGSQKVHFNKGEIDHIKTYSNLDMDLGQPPLSAILVDIEADMFASVYAVTLFKKGGLVRAIVSMDKITNDNDGINEKSYWKFVQRIQQWFERLYGGLRGAGEVVFTPNVNGVYNLVNPKDIEAPHERTSDKTAIKTAELLGCPLERLGLVRTSQYVNNSMTSDTVSLSFDNHYYYLLGLVDEYIYNKIIRDILGEEDVRIQMSGQFGSLSKVQAEFAKLVGEAGAKAITVDEWRTRCLHWEPLGAPYGNMFLGELNIKDQAVSQKVFGLAPELDIKNPKIIHHHPDAIRYY